MMKVSQSRIKAYKACRRGYYLRYVEGVTPNVSAEALETGRKYHEHLETMYNTGSIECEPTKECAMAIAYFAYVYPKLNKVKPEQDFEVNLTDDIQLIGRFDGVADDGFVVEHKTTSDDVGVAYEYGLQFDEQILAYMLASGKNTIHYTVIKKPTIRQKKDETDEEYYQRCLAWYGEDTDNKIGTFDVTRTQEEIDEYKEMLLATIEEMRDCNLFYRNTCNCKNYGRPCEYAPICLNYQKDQEYIGFTRRSRE